MPFADPEKRREFQKRYQQRYRGKARAGARVKEPETLEDALLELRELRQERERLRKRVWELENREQRTVRRKLLRKQEQRAVSGALVRQVLGAGSKPAD